MKRLIFILVCSLCISTYAATEERNEKFRATLPNGTVIELVGLRSYSVGDPQRIKGKSGPWWRPDGEHLTMPPDEMLGRCSWSDSYLFVITIVGKTDCTCKAVGPWDNDLTVEFIKETDKGQGFANKDLRRFTLRCGDRKSADIRLSVATDDWKVVEHWPLSERSTPYNHFFVSSEQAIMRCPEQTGTDVIAEVTQTIIDKATRLVVFDRQSNQYVSYGNEGGKSGSLVRYIHRYRNLNFTDIEHIEFQARPYEYWITFRNVSLQPGQKTQVEIDLKKPGTLLPGQALPNFDSIKINLIPDQIKDKTMLVCFFDMEQRPSRNCIIQLAKRAQEFKEKDVVVIAVQSSKIEENKLNEWITKYEIPFPVGMIQGDEEKIRFTWGVKSLPWLILTDKKHIVRIEGFSLQELDTKLKQIGGDRMIAGSILEPIGKHALSFDGVDDYLHVEANPKLTLKPPFTIEMCIRPDFSEVDRVKNSEKMLPYLNSMRKGKRLFHEKKIQAGGFMMLVGPLSQTDRKCYGNLYLGNADGFLYQVDLSDGEPLQPARPGWLYVSMSCTRETYIPVPEQPLIIGQNVVPSFFPFKGDIAEIRIWSGVRSGDQAVRYRNKPLKGNESGLVACWDFKRAGGQVVYDIGPNGNHAQLGSTEGPDGADPKWIDLKSP